MIESNTKNIEHYISSFNQSRVPNILSDHFNVSIDTENNSTNSNILCNNIIKLYTEYNYNTVTLVSNCFYDIFQTISSYISLMRCKVNLLVTPANLTNKGR